LKGKRKTERQKAREENIGKGEERILAVDCALV
jgi:hypothetical protein